MKTLTIIAAAIAISCTAIGCAKKTETMSSGYSSSTMSTSK